MYKRILSVLNESLNSEIAAKYAMNLAKVVGAKIYLCFIAQKGQSVEQLNRAEETLKRAFIDAEQMGLSAEAISETGDPAKKIGDIARKEAIDIVFASTAREDVERIFYEGTAARKMLMNLPCSVALVRVVHAGKTHPKEILVPLKSRIDHIEERAYFTAKTAQAFGSSVLLFHAPEPITRFFHGQLHLTPLEWESRLPKDISHFMEHLHRYKTTHTQKSVPGRAGKTIAIEALSKRHDLIIMGAAERNFAGKILKGSPVEEMLKNTPCNLIILKPRHQL